MKIYIEELSEKFPIAGAYFDQIENGEITIDEVPQEMRSFVEYIIKRNWINSVTP